MSQENVEIVRRGIEPFNQHFRTREVDLSSFAPDITVDNPGTYLYEIKGGKVVSMRTFTDRAEALEAAGLSE